jgi:ubiquinone/menaquinone biosynthesis C-methylase UbiE
MSNSLLHHLAYPAAALAEMVRVLAPSGWLFVRDLVRPQNDGHVQELVELYAGTENGRQRDLFEASLRAALSLPEVEEAAREAGIAASVMGKTSDRHWTLIWNKL